MPVPDGHGPGVDPEHGHLIGQTLRLLQLGTLSPDAPFAGHFVANQPREKIQ
jgi:hypothetical protein